MRTISELRPFFALLVVFAWPQGAEADLPGSSFAGDVSVRFDDATPKEPGSVFCLAFDEDTLQVSGESSNSQLLAELAYREIDFGFAVIWFAFDDQSGFGFAVPGRFTTFYWDAGEFVYRGVLSPASCGFPP